MITPATLISVLWMVWLVGWLLLALLGTAMVQDTLAALVGATLLVLGLILKISREERLLTEHFGDAYRAYRAEVPSLIPRLRGGGSSGTGH